MDDETRTSAVVAPAANLLHERVVSLLAQIDQESESFRKKITDILTEVESLRTTATVKDVGEDLILQLREANQNLVIATLGAQDLQGKAESANRIQEEFLSMLAHELRNPLAPIAMAAELLGQLTTAHPQLPKLHAIIDRQVKHMTRLVDDLVDAARMQSGKISLERRPVLLAEIMESAIETSQPFIDKRNQELIVHLPVAPVTLDGDLVRLAQVFSNILINAAKFTPEYERITVTAHKSKTLVTVSVKDNGMGIAEDVQPFIFDLFRQGFRTLDRAQGGLGIGLSLVRMIVELHGGSVKVRSAGVGFGSEFIVELPLFAVPQSSYLHYKPEGSFPIRPCRILIIEDNIDSNDTLTDLLTQNGHTVTSVFDGTAGLAKARENDFEVIICDIGLPGIDGFRVVQQLRREVSGAVPCIIGLTGYSQEEFQTRALNEGFDYYLVKPVNSDNLLRIISSRIVL